MIVNYPLEIQATTGNGLKVECEHLKRKTFLCSNTHMYYIYVLIFLRSHKTHKHTHTRTHIWIYIFSYGSNFTCMQIDMSTRKAIKVYIHIWSKWQGVMNGISRYFFNKGNHLPVIIISFITWYRLASYGL